MIYFPTKRDDPQEASMSYLASDYAFLGSKLAERPGFAQTSRAALALMSSDIWQTLAYGRAVYVRQSYDYKLKGQAIAGALVELTSLATHDTVPHEMAHIVQQRQGNFAHDAAWRETFVQLTEIMYGSRYADKLVHAFRLAGLPGRYVVMHNGDRPLISLDDVHNDAVPLRHEQPDRSSVELHPHAAQRALRGS